jgi:hypothetical protein
MNPIQLPTEHAIATYRTHSDAERAVKLLAGSGLAMTEISVIGQNISTEERPVGFINTGERMLVWGEEGAFWGSVCGLLLASAMMFIPGIGYVMFAGWVVGALEGAVVGGGTAALAGALAGIGIPKDSVVRYETALKSGNFLLLARGKTAQVLQAKALLATTGPTSIETYTTEQKAAMGV